MSDSGVVYDLGYTPYDGERRGRRGAIRTTFNDGVARVFGIRRRARKKILPWILIALAVLPAVVFVGFSFLLSTFAPDAQSPFGSSGDYFSLTGAIMLLFVALAGPELLVPDRRSGVLSVYSSRPLRPDDYVWTRMASLLAVIATFLLIPQVLMYIGFAALSADGFFKGLGTNAGEIPKILAATAVYALAYAPLALLIATVTSRKAAATGIFLGVFLLGTALAAMLVGATGIPGHKYAALFAVGEHPDHVREWIFNQVGSGNLVVSDAGIAPWMSLVTILVIAAVSMGIVVWRYRRLM